MGYYDGNWGVGEWLAMGAMMLVFWGLLIGLVIWAIRSFRNGDRATGSGRPDQLLAERYARGEIEEEEFQRRRDLLHSTSGPRT